MSAHLRLIKPRNFFQSVPARPPNAELRTREYLTPGEVEKLIKEARQGRYGHRDATLILIAFRHGLRAAIWNGRKSSSAAPPPCTSGVSRMASRVSTRCAATKSEHCASCVGNSQKAVSSLRRNAEARLHRMRQSPYQAHWRACALKAIVGLRRMRMVISTSAH
jgi:hypothetical protein